MKGERRDKQCTPKHSNVYSGTSHASYGSGKTYGQNSTGTVPQYIEIYKSIPGQQAPERMLVRICGFEIAMMSPPSGFSPFEEGLPHSPVYRFPRRFAGSSWRLASSRVSTLHFWQ